jgi:hypothetical protein
MTQCTVYRPCTDRPFSGTPGTQPYGLYRCTDGFTRSKYLSIGPEIAARELEPSANERMTLRSTVNLWT